MFYTDYRCKEIIIYDTDGTDYSNIILIKPSKKKRFFTAAVEQHCAMKVDNVMCHAKHPLSGFYDPLSIKNVARYLVLGIQELFFKMLALLVNSD